MARPAREYQKVAGRGRPPFPKSLLGGGLASLYLASDHLLRIESTYCYERYRRFYLKDIQVLRVTRNKRALFASILLVVLMLAALLPVLLWHALAAQVIFGIMAGFFFLFLVINLARGPSCVTQIETSIAGENLHSLSHWWKARKALALLLPLISEAQGGRRADLAAQIAETQPPALSFMTVPRAGAAGLSLPATGRPWMARALAGSLLGYGVAALLMILLPGAWAFFAGALLFLSVVIFDVLLLAVPAGGCGRGLTGTVLGWACLHVLFFYLLVIKLSIVDVIARGSKGAPAEGLQFYATLLHSITQQNVWTLSALSVTALSAFLLATIVFFRHWQARTGRV